MRRARLGRWLATATLALGALLLIAGCTLPYYSQAALGHTALLLKRRDVENLVDRSSTPEELRDRLRVLLEIRDYASGELGLPENRSYRSFVDLGRPYPVWNVVAAPELSIEPITWCFPVAGCVAYRGYFARERAERYAARLREDGADVYLYGVAAYSTLGWFADPALSSFIEWPDLDLASLIFHELAHQVAYAPGDTSFNESFASFVAEVGVERWLQGQGRGSEAADLVAAREAAQSFAELVSDYRERLRLAYGEDRSDEWKRGRKQAIFAEMAAAYRSRTGSWAGTNRYDRWFARELNNAHLVSVASYTGLVADFQRLFEASEGDLPRFYEAVRELASLDGAERRSRLEGPGQPTKSSP